MIPQEDDLTYNRTRQAMITKEMIEIISGDEALVVIRATPYDPQVTLRTPMASAKRTRWTHHPSNRRVVDVQLGRNCPLS